MSHHLLADKQIDRWFYEIAQNRKVETFFIISPSHYGLSTQEWSLDDCIWQTKSGMVYTNQKEEKALAEKLGVQYDSQVFPDEHGINTLIPYISRYFPKARVCVITVYGEPPLNQKNAQKLADALQPYFTQKEKKKNFLLISTDFAHHGNLEGTEFKDKRSREFFNNPSDSSWVFCGCDNRPGVYVLSRFLTKQTKSAVLFHTNSYELSGFDEDDITSYFFSFFYD
ncbi:MAG: AmmeMemoRadiSam system protein B [Treponema sp.]|nr:AmmeMemoRadiSam system protein B [Treponema sp.]